jgi:hypothetical protein
LSGVWVGTYNHRAVTDARGRFELDGPSFRLHDVSASRRDLLDRTGLIAAPGHPMRIEMARGGVVTIAVRISDGLCALSRASREVQRRLHPEAHEDWLELELEGSLEGRFQRDVPCDEPGAAAHIRTVGMTDGTYRPRVWFSGIMIEGKRFEIRGANRIEIEMDLSERGGASVIGEVQVPAALRGRPLRWGVCVWPQDGENATRCVDADRRGRFRIDGLRPMLGGLSAEAVVGRSSDGVPEAWASGHSGAIVEREPSPSEIRIDDPPEPDSDCD